MKEFTAAVPDDCYISQVGLSSFVYPKYCGKSEDLDYYNYYKYYKYYNNYNSNYPYKFCFEYNQNKISDYTLYGFEQDSDTVLNFYEQTTCCGFDAVRVETLCFQNQYGNEEKSEPIYMYEYVVFTDDLSYCIEFDVKYSYYLNNSNYYNNMFDEVINSIVINNYFKSGSY